MNHGHGEPVDHRWFKTHTWEARRYWEAKPPASSLWARRPWCMWWWFTVGTMLPASGIHICVSRPIRCCSICLVEWPCTGPNQLASLLLSNVYVALVCMILQRSLLCHFTSIYIYNYWYVNICDWILEAADLDELWAEPFFHQATLLGPQWLIPSPIPWLGFPTKIRQAGFKNHPTLAVWWENHEHWTLGFWGPHGSPVFRRTTSLWTPTFLIARSDTLQASRSPVLDTAWTAGPLEGHAVTAWGRATWSALAIGSSKHFPGIVATWTLVFRECQLWI